MELIEEKLMEIRKKIENSKNVIMFYDADTDGTCSYLLLKKHFPQIKKAYPHIKEDEFQLKLSEKITSKNDLIIFFDTPRLREEFFINANNLPIIWVDHHIITNGDYLNKYKNINFFNPLLFDLKDTRCSAYWAYKISGSKKEDLFYISLASIADFYLLEELIDFYNYSKEEFNLLFKKIPQEKLMEIFEFIKKYKFNDEKSDTQRASYIQYLSYESNLIKFKNFFDLIFKIEKENSRKAIKFIEKLSPFDFYLEINEAKSEYFEKYAQISNELNDLLEKALKIEDSDLIYFHHNDLKFSYTRQISEVLSYYKTKAKVIFVSYEKENNDFISCSFRGKNYDVDSLVKVSLEGLNGQGGGHKYAAGLIIAKTDFDTFKKRIELNFK